MADKKESFLDVVEDMIESAKFNRTPYNELPPECRVHGAYCGEAVVTRPAVAERIEGWVVRLRSAWKRRDGRIHRLQDATPVQNPIRNCNRFSDIKKAWAAYRRECCEYMVNNGERVYFKKKGAQDFDDWLFAPSETASSSDTRRN